jgi:predicted HTH transcriptional regulator
MPTNISGELIEVIQHGTEERHIEYKPSMSWIDRKRIEIVKCILGMANIPGGGFIVIGIEQKDNDFVLSGMIPEHFESFTQDLVDDVVKDYADPFVKFYVKKIGYENKDFVVIQVNEFGEIPVICRKSFPSDGKVFLREGAIYTRPSGKSETTEVSTQTEMREIIDMAVVKSLQQFIRKMGQAGILDLIKPKYSDEQEYDEELDKNLRE